MELTLEEFNLFKGSYTVYKCEKLMVVVCLCFKTQLNQLSSVQEAAESISATSFGFYNSEDAAKLLRAYTQ